MTIFILLNPLHMFFLAATEPLISLISILAILVIGISLLLKKVKQPYIVGYILIGLLIGDHGLGLLGGAIESETVRRLGELGIVLLLFFIGMEISLPDLVKQWRLAVIGTLLQVVFSVLAVVIAGYFFGWQIERSIILGFVIALSSSAIIIKLLEDKNLINSDIGKNILSILLTQDIIIVPMLIASSFIGGEGVPIKDIILMIVGGVLIVGGLIYIYSKKHITLPFSKNIESDHELQVFIAILLCFGCAFISSIFGLSAALGAFVGGMIMHAANSTHWIHDVLHSFRVLFVAFFFISIGLQINISFILENMTEIGLMLVLVYVTNHFINTIILKFFGNNWHDAILGGAFLAQIGELSFLLSFSAFHLGIIGSFGYNFTISLISLTLIISPIWISVTSLFIRQKSKI